MKIKSNLLRKTILAGAGLIFFLNTISFAYTLDKLENISVRDENKSNYERQVRRDFCQNRTIHSNKNPHVLYTLFFGAGERIARKVYDKNQTENPCNPQSNI